MVIIKDQPQQPDTAAEWSNSLHYGLMSRSSVIRPSREEVHTIGLQAANLLIVSLHRWSSCDKGECPDVTSANQKCARLYAEQKTFVHHTSKTVALVVVSLETSTVLYEGVTEQTFIVD